MFETTATAFHGIPDPIRCPPDMARLSLAAAITAPERFPLLILGGIGGRQFETHLRTDAMAEAMETADPDSDICALAGRAFVAQAVTTDA